MFDLMRFGRRRHDSLVLEVTRRCNHRCLHCYNVWKNATPYPQAEELGTAEMLAMVGRVLDNTGARLMSLSGGEPFLRSDIFEIVEFIAARGVAVNLITNGSFVTEEVVGRLTPGKVSVWELPLLSIDRETHDLMSGAAGAMDRTTVAIARLKAARQRVVAVFVATRLNLPHWRETAELAFALGADGIMFNRFNPGGEGSRHIDELQASPGELAAALETAEEFSAAHKVSISCSIAMPPCLFDITRYTHLTFGFCAAGTERAYYTIDPCGNLRPCNHSPTILGNLRERGFWDMVDSPEARRFAAARPTFCAGCRIEGQCLGGCKAAAEACSGSISAMDPFLAANAGRVIRPR
jgi:radical SAM protein with 4Fe4S-binding SPASM domain